MSANGCCPTSPAVSPSSLDDWERCPRLYLDRHLLRLPESDAGHGRDHRATSCTTCSATSTARATATIRSVARRRSRTTGSPPTDPSRRCCAATPTGAPLPRPARGHELEVVRASRAADRSGSATGRLDAVWEHDGILDVRDYKTGLPRDGSLAEDIRARVQAWLAAPLAGRPPAAGPLRAPRRRRGRRSGRVRARRRGPRPHRGRHRARSSTRSATPRPGATFPGVADAEICRTCSYRSICPGQRRAGRPHLADARGRSHVEARALLESPRSCRSTPAPPSSSASARRSSAPPTRAPPPSPSTCSPTPPAAALADAGRAAAPSTRSRSPRSSRGAIPIPGALLARRLGIEPRTTILTTTGGNSPQMLVNRLGAAILAGEHDVVLVGGVECMYSRRRARRIDPKAWLDWTKADDPPCPNVVGDARPGIEPVRDGPPRARADPGVPAVRDRDPPRRRATTSTRTNARSATCGRTSPRSRRTNPYAWSPTAYTPDEIRDAVGRQPHGVLPVHEAHVRQPRRRPGRRVRPLLVRGRRSPRAWPTDRMVFPHRGRRRARPLLRHRARVARRVDRDRHRRAAPRSRRPGSRSTTSPASTCTRASRRRCSSRSRRSDSPGPTGGDDRPITVTGGLPYAGGPGNNYVGALDRGDGRRVPRRTRARSGSSPRSAGTPPSTASASTPPSHRPAGFRAVDPGRDPARGRRRPAPRAGRAWSTATGPSRRRRSRSTATARPRSAS